MRIAVSACLVGENVTYRGDSNKNEKIIEILTITNFKEIINNRNIASNHN